MPRVDSGGHATAVANGHCPKKLISISRQDCAAGAHTCVPGMTIKAAQARHFNLPASLRQARHPLDRPGGTGGFLLTEH